MEEPALKTQFLKLTSWDESKTRVEGREREREVKWIALKPLSQFGHLIIARLCGEWIGHGSFNSPGGCEEKEEKENNNVTGKSAFDEDDGDGWWRRVGGAWWLMVSDDAMRAPVIFFFYSLSAFYF